MEKTRLLNIPNVLTGLRILGILGFVASFFILPKGSILPLVLFIFAACTDFFDGYLARKLGQVTWVGQLLDPLADKLMAVSVLYCYCMTGILSVWFIVLVVIKELYMVIGASVLLRRHCVVHADSFGKIATALFIPATVLIYPCHNVPWIQYTGMGMLYISVGLSVLAAVHYTRCALKQQY